MATLDIKHGDPITSDFFTVKCKSSVGNATYENLHSGIHRQESSVKSLPSNTMGLNVLILGMDSVSRVAWKRLFPKTYDYFERNLGGIILEVYNILGDGTPAALLPILCGKFEEELPAAERGKPNAKPVDGHPWIWKKFHELGYMTQYTEDQPQISTFNYRMWGFKEQPVHHYMRPFHLKYENKKGNLVVDDECLGSKRLHVISLDWIQEFFTAYENRLKFSFTFLGGLTHGGFTFAADADNDLLAFLQAVERGDNMKNTLFILMSDHGPRFQAIRQSVQGRFEERMPFMGIRLPPEFKAKYPIALKNLRINSQRLTTAFDIHETLLDVINFQGDSKANLSYRGISLFREIPLERNCLHAGIDAHWCACQNWKALPTNDSLVQNASLKLVATINSITDDFRKLCQQLSLSQIIRAGVYIPSENMLPEEKKASWNEVYYSVTIRVTPGKGMFEATLKYDTQFIVRKNDISRIDAYGSQSQCILQSNPSLLRYCYCSTPWWFGGVWSDLII